MYRLIVLFLLANLLIFCKNKNQQSIENSEFSDTLFYYNKLLINQPNSDTIYYQKGIYFIQHNNIDSGLFNLELAIQLNKRKPQYFYSLSDAYLLALESRKAESILDTLNNYFPNHIPALLKNARVKLILKKYSNALSLIDYIFMLDPNNVEANYLAGHIFYEQGDTGRAVKCYQKSVDLDPEFTEAWIQLGDVMSALNNSLAIRYYDNALRLDSNNIETLHNRAYAIQLFGKISDAVNAYQNNIVRRPDFELSYYNLGIIYQEKDSLMRAVEYFNQAILINSQEPSSYYHRGYCKLKLGDKESAKKDLQQAVHLYPDYKEATLLIKKIK